MSMLQQLPSRFFIAPPLSTRLAYADYFKARRKLRSIRKQCTVISGLKVRSNKLGQGLSHGSLIRLRTVDESNHDVKRCTAELLVFRLCGLKHFSVKARGFEWLKSICVSQAHQFRVLDPNWFRCSLNQKIWSVEGKWRHFSRRQAGANSYCGLPSCLFNPLFIVHRGQHIPPILTGFCAACGTRLRTHFTTNAGISAVSYLRLLRKIGCGKTTTPGSCSNTPAEKTLIYGARSPLGV